MRGPLDDAIEIQEQPVAAAAGRSEAEQPQRPRPPGGKALIRLLQLLETAGYTEAASETIELAVPDAARDDFREMAPRFRAAPSGEAPGGGGRRRTRARRRHAAADEDGEAIDVGAATEAVADMYLTVGEQLGPPTTAGPQWRSIGPWTMPNGQTYGASRVNVSGRVSAIAVDPRDPAHVLVGAANGGVWESRDRGASWAPRSDYAPTLAVGALAFDPRTPATVYCGTGEGNWWWFLGGGVLRSSDGGASWSTLCTAPFVGQGFYDLIVDPGDAQHLLAATTGGLY